jgi:type I restriction enzyme S subunit
VARCCIVSKFILPARVNQYVAIICPEKNFVDYRFLFYYLQSLKSGLLICAEISATRNAITKGVLENINIFLLSLRKAENNSFYFNLYR